MEQTNSTSNKVSIIFAILFFFALLGGGYFWKQNYALTATNQELSGKVDMLEQLRVDLVKEVETLQREYDKTVSENDQLGLLFEKTTERVIAQKEEIRKIKRTAAKDAAGVKAEIEQLQGLRDNLRGYIKELHAENARLRASNRTLNKEVTEVKNQNKALEFQISELRQMNIQLEKEKTNLMATSSRAADFRVDILKKGDKPTGSYRRAKEITVSFAVNNIPANKKGDHTVYVVIKDAKGIPVKVANPIQVTITPDAGGKPEPIIAQQKQIANLFDKDRLQFKVTPVAGSLHAGYYRAVIYTDWGLLGGAEFQLR